MTALTELEAGRKLQEDLRAIDTPQALADLEQVKQLQHASQQLQLGQDAYQSANESGTPPTGWLRVSEMLTDARRGELNRLMPELTGINNEQLREYLKPDSSGFRAEIYLPDPEILGPGYKPTVAFKGSSGPIMMSNGERRETVAEDFAGTNGPQTIGLKTDFYDRAMRLAFDLQQAGVSVDYTGHSLGGGMTSAAVAVSGERGFTLNAAPLHPETALRFARENPGVQIYNTDTLITAYQVQGEILSNGVVHNIDRLDTLQNKQLADVFRHGSTILQNVPDEVREELKERMGQTMPEHARASFGAFVDRLATGDTDAMLRDMPPVAGRVVPIPAMRRSDPDDPNSPFEPRPNIPSLAGVSNFAGPLLELAQREAHAARAGSEVGEWVETGGKLQARSFDTTGNAARAAAEVAADLQRDATQAIGSTAAGGVRASGEASADMRTMAGVIGATVEMAQGELQARSASAGAGLLRNIGEMDVLPDGVQRWANRGAETLQQAGQTARQYTVEQAGEALHAAGRQSAAIREHSQTVAQTLETVTVTGSRNQHDAIAYAGKSLHEVLEIASNKLAQASGYAPAAGAVVFAGAALKTNALQSHDNANEVAKTAAAGSLLMPAGLEGFQRHLNDTGVPSMEAKLETFETELRQKYPLMSSHGNARENDDAQRAPGYAQITPSAIRHDITHADHPGNRLYRQAVDAIEQSRNIPQGTFTGERLQQSAANLTAVSVAGEDRPNNAGSNERLGQIDYAVFNKDHSGLIAGQGQIGNPISKHAYLPAEQDNATSLPLASQQVYEVLQRSQSIALTATPSQQTLDPSQNDPGRGPKMG